MKTVLTSLVLLSAHVDGQQNLYPKLLGKQMVGIPRSSTDSAVTVEGWALDINLYVVTDFKNADPKFGISLGISPPPENDFITYQIY